MLRTTKGRNGQKGHKGPWSLLSLLSLVSLFVPKTILENPNEA